MINFSNSIIEKHVLTGFRGVLVIGDPLLGPHKRVGRVDDVWSTGMAKLTESLKIAEQLSLVPILVGDILHDARDIGQLVPLIQLLRGRKAIILPRNGRWNEQGQGHLAAVLHASGLAYVAGHSAKSFQIPISNQGVLTNLTLECHTSWGGQSRLEFGEKARIVVPELGLTITHGSTPLLLDKAEDGVLEVGRLIRLSKAEESLKIHVCALTLDGLKLHELTTTPIVFSESAASALEKNLDLNRDSLFVDKLREAAQSALEDEGKGDLIGMITDVCTDLGSDTWIQETMLSLAKEATGLDNLVVEA